MEPPICVLLQSLKRSYFDVCRHMDSLRIKRTAQTPLLLLQGVIDRGSQVCFPLWLIGNAGA